MVSHEELSTYMLHPTTELRLFFVYFMKLFYSVGGRQG